jgi:hypothetical protein
MMSSPTPGSRGTRAVPSSERRSEVHEVFDGGEAPPGQAADLGEQDA